MLSNACGESQPSEQNTSLLKRDMMISLPCTSMLLAHNLPSLVVSVLRLHI